jgi:hypothetical protein
MVEDLDHINLDESYPFSLTCPSMISLVTEIEEPTNEEGIIDK